jgi:hypothetical protein
MGRAAGQNLGLADFHLLRAIERVGGVTPFIIGGRSTVIKTTEQEVWEQDASYAFPTSELGLTAVSDDAADAAAGTGLRTLMVYGVDEEYNAVEAEITLTGLTPTAATTVLFYRVNKVVIKTSGAGNVNAGDILIKHGTNTVGGMIAGVGASYAGVYTVPAGHSFIARTLILGVDKLTNTTLRVYYMKPGEGWVAVRQVNLYQSTVAIPANGTLLPAGTDIRITGIGSAAGTVVTCEILCQLISDEAIA